MAREIFDILGDSTVVNGYSGGKQINGAGDMCVQLIAELKRISLSRNKKEEPVVTLNQPGNFYLLAAGTRDAGEEYTYTLDCTGGDIFVTVSGYKDKPLFEGTMSEYGGWLKRESEKDDDG